MRRNRQVRTRVTKEDKRLLQEWVRESGTGSEGNFLRQAILALIQARAAGKRRRYPFEFVCKGQDADAQAPSD